MGKELEYGTNDERLALVTAFWVGFSEPLLSGFRADNQCSEPVKGGQEQEGTHRWWGRG